MFSRNLKTCFGVSGFRGFGKDGAKLLINNFPAGDFGKMGGFGSGPSSHYWRLGRKRLCEDAWKIDSGDWQKRGWFKKEPKKCWAVDSDGRKLPIAYRIVTGGINVCHYPSQLAYGIPTDPVETPFGIASYWKCPLMRSGRICGRRCKILYLPPGEPFFGCRECHRLTYRSSQEAGCRNRSIKHLSEIGEMDDILKAWL